MPILAGARVAAGDGGGVGSTGKLLLASTSLVALTLGMAHRDLAWADTTISSSTGVQNWTSGNFTITNTGTISGGSRPITSSGTLGTLTNSGTISGTRTGIYSGGTIAAVTNSGIIAGTLGGFSNIAGGRVATFLNTATISGGNTGFANRGSIGTLINNGTLVGTGSYFGIGNSGTISTLDNSGSISGNTGINNSGTIAALTNSGSVSARGGGVGIWNTSGSIGTLSNSGTISGGVTTALGNAGSIGTLTNSGVITDVNWGLYNSGAGTIGILANSAGGTIHGGHTGLNNAATIGVLTNAGTISGGSLGLLNSGSIGTLTNSGVIAGLAQAIAISSGSIGPITNSGVIAGAILNSTSNALTIAGGTGSTFGLLTGYNSGTPSLASPGAVGSITSTSADLVFSTGNLLLNDNINVGATHTVRNTGATLQIQNPITISGAYSQSGGGLVVVTTGGGGSYGYVTVSGNATVSNATITISGSGLRAGETFSVVRSGGTGSYINDTAAVSGTGALTATVTASGNDLLVTLVGNSTHYTQLGQTAGGAAVGMGPALDAVNQSSSAAATAFQNTVLKSLDALPAANQPAAVKQLAPTQLSPFLQVATQAVAPVVAAIEQHQLAMLRDGGVGAAAGSGGHDDAVWGQALGGQAVRDSTAGADGYRANYAGLAVGFDHQATPALVVGVALSWLRGRSLGLDGSAGSNVTTDNYQLTAYGLQRFGRAFIDGEAGLGYTNFNQNRVIGFLGADAHANYGGMLYLARIGAGYDVPIGGNVTFTPLGGLRFLSVVSGAYTESGAGNADLGVDRHGTQALTQDLGGKVAWQMNTRWGAFRPEVRLAWVHDYTQGPIAASGLIGGEGFISPVTRLSADGARMNLAATLERSDELTLRVEYEGEIRANYHSQTGVIRVNWAF